MFLAQIAQKGCWPLLSSLFFVFSDRFWLVRVRPSGVVEENPCCLRKVWRALKRSLHVDTIETHGEQPSSDTHWHLGFFYVEQFLPASRCMVLGSSGAIVRVPGLLTLPLG